MHKKILYIGDVPIRNTVAGSVILYRLFSFSKENKFFIIETDAIPSNNAAMKLDNTQYYSIRYLFSRLLRTRLHQIAAIAILIRTSLPIFKLDRYIKKIRPDLILSVSHGFTWYAAFKGAKKYNIPFKLICHDDVVMTVNVPSFWKNIIEKRFAKVYKLSEENYCVSPFMQEFYKSKYDVESKVLYPLIPLSYFIKSVKQSVAKPKLIFAYTGTINSGGYADNIIDLANAIDGLNAEIFIYSDIKHNSFAKFKNVVFKGFIPSHLLRDEIITAVDILFVTMDFNIHFKSNMQIGFPTKIIDYATTGLPILIYGPEYCSAVNWASNYKEGALIVSEKNVDDLRKAVVTLINNLDMRIKMGNNLNEIGQKHFTFELNKNKVYQLFND